MKSIQKTNTSEEVEKKMTLREYYNSLTNFMPGCNAQDWTERRADRIKYNK